VETQFCYHRLLVHFFCKETFFKDTLTLQGHKSKSMSPVTNITFSADFITSFTK